MLQCNLNPPGFTFGKGFEMSSKIGQRINRWLEEAPGETFKDGKWRFWLPMLLGFSLLNAVMTAVIFGTGGNLQTYIGGIMLSIGALLAWLCIGTLHYSDSSDAKLA